MAMRTGHRNDQKQLGPWPISHRGCLRPVPLNAVSVVVSYNTSQGTFILCSLCIQLWPLQRFSQVFYGPGKGFLLI